MAEDLQPKFQRVSHSVWRTPAVLLLTLGISLCISNAQALEVREFVWGFDGRVLVGHFNPLSIHLENSTAEAFDGRLRLVKTYGAGSQFDAPIEEEIFLAPYTSRWVQLYPYSLDGREDWVLSWGRGGDQRIELSAPRVGVPATVLLTETNAIIGDGGGIRRFSEELFPPLVTATDGLEALGLDFMPRWEMNRRQAFLDWLRRGGTVYVLQDISGKYPTFSGELAALNAPLTTFRVGAGKVVREPKQRRAFLALPKSTNSVAPSESPGSETSAGDKATQGDTESIDARIAETTSTSPQAAGNNAGGAYQNGYDPDAALSRFPEYNNAWSDELLFTSLNMMTQPDHNWPLIHVMTWTYFLLIFPGCYLLGRRRFDYRWSIVGFVLAVVVFSYSFLSVGSRGYGEASTVSSVAIARPLADDVFDVTQWSNAFVTNGDQYRIQGPGTGHLFTTAQSIERVRGVVDNGVQGNFDVDMPPFSSRTILHRSRVQSTPIKLTVEDWRLDEDDSRLIVTTEDGFPATRGPIVAIYGDQVYMVRHSGNRLSLAKWGNGTSGLLRQAMSGLRYRNNWGWNEEDTRSLDRKFDEMRVSLIARSLGAKTGIENQPSAQQTIIENKPGRGCVRFFIYADLPADFHLQSNAFEKQQGRVLYCIDVFKPEKQ